MTARVPLSPLSMLAILAACSTPDSSTPTAVTLPPATGPEWPVVSAIEAGRPAALSLVPASTSQPAPPAGTSKRSEVRRDATPALIQAALSLTPSTVEVTTLATMPTLAPVPMAAAPRAAPAAVPEGDDLATAVAARGPVVIIRGGPGGLHDDCAIHNRGRLAGRDPFGTRPGLAVNNRLPPRSGTLGR